MTQPAPETIYKRLYDRLTAHCKDSTKFMDANGLFARGLSNDINKLTNVDFDEFATLSMMFYAECGNHERAIHYANLLFDRNPESAIVINNILFLGNRLLRPSVVQRALPCYTERPCVFFEHSCLEIMTLGFYKQFLSSLEALKRANKISSDVSEYERIARVMQEIGVSEETSTQIIECVGNVLEKHHLRWHDGAPWYTAQSGEVGAWFKVDVSPSKAAQLDVELADVLITKGLDTEPFFVSFVGTAQ